MTTPRIIKKYTNRRLYDTQISSYITLDDIRELVLDGEEFSIVDNRTGEDITRTILLQVISEQEEGGDPIFSADVLRNIIRFYGDSMQSTMSSYLELSLDMFNEQQQQFQDHLRDMLGASNPLNFLHELSREQMPLWRSVRRQYLRNLSRHDETDDDGCDEDEDAGDSDAQQDEGATAESNPRHGGDESR